MMNLDHQIEYFALRRLDELEAALASLHTETSDLRLVGPDIGAKHVLEEAIRLRRIYERVQELLP
jgi:hypothetical protein